MRWSAPSERNYAIFCSIEFEGRSLREVAAEFGISVVRVQQILAQVRKWFVANVPAWSRELEPVLQPLVAHDIFEHKLQHLTRQTMAAFGATHGEQTVKCQKLDVLQATGGGWSRTRISGGEPKYIALGVRLAEVQLEAAMKVAQWRLDHKEEEAAALAKYADLPPYMTLAEHEQELRAEAAEPPCALAQGTAPPGEAIGTCAGAKKGEVSAYVRSSENQSVVRGSPQRANRVLVREEPSNDYV